MADRPECIAPRPAAVPWNEAAPFRETFVRSFLTDPRHVRAVHEFGALLYEVLAEAASPAPGGTNWTASLLHGFAADLSYTSQLLLGTVAEAGGSAWEDSAALEAERWASRLAAIAADIEAFVETSDAA
jgi:hypothetical protein